MLFIKVYTSVLTEADEATFHKIIELHNSSDLQEEKMRIANALGSVKDEKLITEVLKFALSVKKFLYKNTDLEV